ncbi:MAG: type II secretion system protein GspM [Caldimonas sp.]
MNTEAIGTPPPAAGLQQQAETFWRGRTLRERQALGAGMVGLIVVLVWLLLVQPAWRTVQQAPAQLDQLDRQLQQIQATAGEVKSLRAVPPVSAPQANAALKAATDRLGDKGRLSMQGDRASLTLTGVSTDALRGWLNEVRSAARARPIEASLSRVPQGYSGTIVVTLGGAP